MGDTKPVYVRMPISLREKVSEFAKQNTLSSSEAICLIAERGLKFDELQSKFEKCVEEGQVCKLNCEKLNGQVSSLNTQLTSVQNALRGLRSLIQTQVAKCKACSAEISLQNLALRSCPNCGSSAMELLDDYKGPVTAGQAIERMLAIVGGIFLASQLLGDKD